MFVKPAARRPGQQQRSGAGSELCLCGQAAKWPHQVWDGGIGSLAGWGTSPARYNCTAEALWGICRSSRVTCCFSGFEHKFLSCLGFPHLLGFIWSDTRFCRSRMFVYPRIETGEHLKSYYCQKVTFESTHRCQQKSQLGRLKVEKINMGKIKYGKYSCSWVSFMVAYDPLGAVIS